MRAYIIVEGGTFNELAEKVEELVVEGYVPVGGVSLLVSRFAQVVFHEGVAGLFNYNTKRADAVSPGPVPDKTAAGSPDVLPITIAVHDRQIKDQNNG